MINTAVEAIVSSSGKNLQIMELMPLMCGTNFLIGKHNVNLLTVLAYLRIIAGRQELLMLTVKRRKLSRFDHVCRHNTLPKIILQGTVNGSRR